MEGWREGGKAIGNQSHSIQAEVAPRHETKSRPVLKIIELTRQQYHQFHGRRLIPPSIGSMWCEGGGDKITRLREEARRKKKNSICSSAGVLIQTSVTPPFCPSRLHVCWRLRNSLLGGWGGVGVRVEEVQGVERVERVWSS